MERFLTILLAALCISACTYPFEPDFGKASDNIIIEGDIIIGGQTKVAVSHLLQLTESGGEKEAATVYVEGKKGKRYPGTRNNDGSYTVNTSEAPADDNYRLYVKTNNGKEYASAWQPVCRAPKIDDITYAVEGDRLVTRLNLTAGEGQRYFRWSYIENWEYHALFEAKYLYTPPANGKGQGKLTEMKPSQSTYKCYGTAASFEIMTTSLEGVEGNKATGLKIKDFEKTDAKISVLYSMDLRLQSMTKDAYDYWVNLEKISGKLGTLDAPVPSEMRGNIECLTEPGEKVIGYINVSEIDSKRIFIYDSAIKFYDNHLSYQYVEEELVREDKYYAYYLLEYLPTEYSYFDGYYDFAKWAPARCVDCRLLGGTTRKPDYWPL